VLFYFKIKGDNMKFNLILIIIFISVLVYAGIQSSSGIVGVTIFNGDGCICHNFEPNASVQVWIEGPDTVVVRDTVDFKILMTGGSSVKGGYNVATIYGALAAIDSFSQTMVYVDTLPSQLTHTFPRPFGNATVYWDFVYIAPDTTVTDTVYSVGNSVNDDGNPQVGDEWNYGANFPVTVIDNPVTVEDVISPVHFSLSQNYPNPFNPSTTIKYTIPLVASGFSLSVTLKIYDILGNEVATLVNEEKPAGTYQVSFNGSQLTSGIYFYKLQVNGFVETKKMALLR
jgi:hypothetical protein